MEIRKRIAVMPESPGLCLRLSVAENLGCFADLYEVPDPRDRIDRAPRAVHLADRARDACGTLSKGLRQRVAPPPPPGHPCMGVPPIAQNGMGGAPMYEPTVPRRHAAVLAEPGRL